MQLHTKLCKIANFSILGLIRLPKCRHTFCMNKKLSVLLTLIVAVMTLTEVSWAGRIVNRKVKDSPKVCSDMKQDSFLSRAGKKVYGTERTSVIIENKVSVVNDLGKKICAWEIDKLSPYGNVTDFKFYIDEYKNYIYPYVKNSEDDSVTTLKISLNSCQIEETEEDTKFSTPKCDKPVIKKNKRARKKA